MWAAVRWLVAGLGLILGAYAVYVGVTWARYGHMRRPRQSEDEAPLLDRFIPAYDVSGRHEIPISAPAAITLAAAREMDLLGLPVVRAIIRGRELAFGSTPDEQPRPRGPIQGRCWHSDGVSSLRFRTAKIVVGAVTQPWKANVVFQALPPDQFATFQEPGYVKIVWTLRADPSGRHPLCVSSRRRVPSRPTRWRAPSFVGTGRSSRPG